MTLTEFLLARLAEDEAGIPGLRGDGRVSRIEARMLRECAAKRRIVEDHTPGEDHPGYSSTRWISPTCQRCVSFHADMDCENQAWPCLTLRALAAVYADHPDYDPTWAA